MTEDQAIARGYGISGSLLPAIMGLTKYASPFDAYVSVLTRPGVNVESIPNEPGRQPAEWGKRHEPAMAQKYLACHPDIVLVKTGHVRSQKEPWRTATPDWLVYDRDTNELVRGLEGKCSQSADRYGDGPTDIPPEHLAQGSGWYASIFDVPWSYVVLLLGNDYREYDPPRDAEWEQTCWDAGRRFWVDHILAEVVPDATASENLADSLKKLYARVTAPLVETEDPEIAEMAKQVRMLRDDAKAFEERKDAAEDLLKGRIGASAGFSGKWGEATWSANKDSNVIDVKGLVADSAPALVKKHTSTRPGARVLRVKLSTEKE